VAKESHGQKPPKSKTLSRVSASPSVARQATNQEVGDTADKITRAPAKKSKTRK